MRKIEMLMNTAIKNNTDWHMSNTRVDNNEGVSTVYLHNNKIAEIGEDFVRVFDGGWQSNTTKSRLNAIINEFCNAFTDGVFQKDFQWYVRDNKVTHDFVNGYTFAEFAWGRHCKPHHTIIMTQSPNDFDLFHLKENYVNHIIDGMDVDSLAQIAHDLLMDEYEKLTWDEVTEEIVNLYDEDTLVDLIPDAN